MKRKSMLTIAITAAVVAATAFAQDQYSLTTQSGIAFSDFKGYENWVMVSSAQTEDRLKVMVANPTMIEAYRAGVPGNGKAFPDGSKMVKLQWKLKKSTEAPFVVNVPDTFAEVFLMQKDGKRFADSGGWGYAVFNYDPATDKYTPTADPTNCGHACHVAVKSKDHVFHPYQKR